MRVSLQHIYSVQTSLNFDCVIFDNIKLVSLFLYEETESTWEQPTRYMRILRRTLLRFIIRYSFAIESITFFRASKYVLQIIATSTFAISESRKASFLALHREEIAVHLFRSFCFKHNIGHISSKTSMASLGNK